jgi:hypothetical protein
VSHIQNNYTLFDAELKEPLEIELNKSSYSANFKQEGTIFFWIEEDKVIESGKNKLLKLEDNVRIGIAQGPVTWFDDEHCAFGWICSRDNKLLNFLKQTELKTPELTVNFTKDNTTIF